VQPGRVGQERIRFELAAHIWILPRTANRWPDSPPQIAPFEGCGFTQIRIAVGRRDIAAREVHGGPRLAQFSPIALTAE
jgi:hypothetical protein